MLNFPSEIREKFLQFFSTEWRASYIVADKQGRLLQWGGKLDLFGFKNLSVGQKAEDQVLALFGLLNPSSFGQEDKLFLEHVRLDSNLYADILIVYENNQFIIFFKDSSEKAVHIFDVQQSRNNLKLLVEALEHSIYSHKKLRTTFLEGFAGVSHEIKNSLITIQDTFQEMKTETSLSKINDWRKIGEGAMKHLQSLVYQTMDFSKLETGNQSLHLSPVLLSDFFSKLHSALAPIAVRKGLNLHFETSFEDIEMVFVDELKLYQIFTNLVGNALNYTDSGYVKISVGLTKQENNTCNFIAEISDSGIGISEKEQKLIFEQFNQVQSESSHRVRGVGLGLSITKSLIDIMGGSLSLSSKLGVGSSFEFKLNLQRTESNLEQSQPSAEVLRLPTHISKLAANPLAILMADDDPANCLLFQRIFEGEGHEVTVVTSGKTALELVDKKQYDLIVLDRQMPQLDGFATCEEMRAKGIKSKNGPIPIVIYTADEQVEFKDLAIKAGANTLITKGCGRKALFETLDRVLSESSTDSKLQKG